MNAPKKVYQQATTGMLHLRRECGVTSRTRYSHFEVDFTDELREQSPRCGKCWDGYRPGATTEPETLEQAIVAREELQLADASGYTLEQVQTLNRLEATESSLVCGELVATYPDRETGHEWTVQVARDGSVDFTCGGAFPELAKHNAAPTPRITASPNPTSIEAQRDVALAVDVLRNDLGLDPDEALELLVERQLIPESSRKAYRDRYFAVAKHLRAFVDHERKARLV
jgi:hypothetical protein